MPTSVKRKGTPFPSYADQGPARPSTFAAQRFQTIHSTSFQPAPMFARPAPFDDRRASRLEPKYASALSEDDPRTQISGAGWHLTHARSVATTAGAAFLPPEGRTSLGVTGAYRLPGYTGYVPVVDADNLYGLSYNRHANEASRIRAQRQRRLEPLRSGSAPDLTSDPLERATRAMRRRQAFNSPAYMGPPFQLLHPL